MGQKVHPKKIRKNFSDSYFISNWFSDSVIYSKLLHQDLSIVNFVVSKFKSKSILLNRFGIKRSIDHYGNTWLNIQVELYPLYPSDWIFKTFYYLNIKSIFDQKDVFINVKYKAFSPYNKLLANNAVFKNYLHYKLRFLFTNILRVIESITKCYVSLNVLNLSSYDFELKEISDNINSLNRYKSQKYYLEVLRIFSMIMLSKSENKYPFYNGGNVHVRPSAELLASFISFWITEVNQHKTFLEFVEGVINCFFHSIEKNDKLKGVKILCKGRIQGMDRSRKTWISVGTIPLHTISANVDYAQSSSVTKYGTIGLKVWLFYTNKTNTNVVSKTIKI